MECDKMMKSRMIDNPVIYLRLDPSDKQNLTVEAQKRGMQNSTLVRMVVLEFLNKCAKEK
jgi:antitoxin component of RelBE/YafQ-DinJ toxin-antitoxin module